MAQQNPKPQGKQRVQLELPKSLEAVYANIAFISHTPAELVIDFAQLLPRNNKGRVVSRVIMSPIHAKLLHSALAKNLANYERQFGEIRIPRRQSIADDFFRYRQADDSDDSDE